MHRADISRATGRAFLQTAEHDGRVIALVVRDLARTLKDTLRGRTVVFDLSGAAGGRLSCRWWADIASRPRNDAIMG